MTVTGPVRRWWHYGWAAMVVGALLLNAFLPFVQGFSVWAFSLLAYPVAAALILSNRPGNGVGRMLAVGAVAAGVIFIGSWVAWTWIDSAWSRYLEALINPAVPVLFWGAIGLLYVFPTGAISNPFTRRFFSVFTVVVGALALLALFPPGPMAVTGRDNPLGGPEWVGTVFDVGIAILLPALLVGIWSVFARRRVAGTMERAQMKWFLAGTVALIAMVLVVGFVPEPLPSPYEQMLIPVVVAGFWALPVAIVVAVTRYRLYEIDRIISRAVSYVIVAGSLGAVFFTLVVGLQAVLPTGSSLAVAGSTLAVSALFNPLRRRVQRVVDRRFNRTRYDAEQVVARMVSELRDNVEVGEIVARTEQVIGEVFGPRSMALWVGDRELRRRVSTTARAG